VFATSASSAAGTAGGSIASGGSSQPAGGSTSAGGTSGTASQSGGSSAGGGSAAEGGSAATGGSATPGGTTATGGSAAGATATGGAATSGGATGGTLASAGTLGGKSATGGTGGIAGIAGGGTGGSAATGGSATTGGSRTTGGSIATGGTSGTGGASGGTTTGGSSGTVGDAASFHCVNWADARDNFQAGVLQPSGLSTTDTYATVLAKANAILSGFQTALSANSIRIPINEPTISNTAWWTAYKGIIDAAISKNMKVMVAYWYKPGVGTVPDMNAFYSMWQAVVDAYGSNNLVYFDIINEPSGYSATAFINLAVEWMGKFPSVSKNRVVVAGSYNDTNVTQHGADARLAGCILNIHIYAIGSTDANPANWTNKLKTAVGAYANRTVVSEYGAPMTSGYDYSGAVNGTAFIAYMQAVTSQIRTSGMGSCYWPGLRNGDWYSITTLKGTGSNLSLSVNSTSGLALIQSAWGM
jgi:Transcription elongation factor